MTLEYLSNEKSDRLLNDETRTGLGEVGVVSLGMLGMVNLRAGALIMMLLASVCLFMSEIITGIPDGVVTLMSLSVSTEVEALISGEEDGDEAVLCVLVDISVSAFTGTLACTGALFMGSYIVVATASFCFLRRDREPNLLSLIVCCSISSFRLTRCGG